MKVLPSVFAALALLLTVSKPGHANSRPRETDFDSTTRFIFYSVLEGCYEDGLTNRDADQILLRPNPTQGYVHFIYSCPICMPTIWAVQTYRARPAAFFGLKSAATSFGPGLPAALEKQLFSTDPHQQLIAINLLVKTWITRPWMRCTYPPNSGTSSSPT